MCKQFTKDLSKMHKKGTTTILIFMLVLSMSLVFCVVPKISATQTLYVSPTQYTTIQAAINAANSGDTIQVASGVYDESIILNKSVSLIGENPSNTIIDSSGTGNNTILITTSTNNVKIEALSTRTVKFPSKNDLSTVTLQKLTALCGAVTLKLICANEYAKLKDATVELLCTMVR